MIVKYSKKFPYAPYLNEDIGYDKSIPENATEEEMIQAIIDLNRIATAAYARLNPSPTLSITDYNRGDEVKIFGETAIYHQPTNEEPERRIGLIADDILSSPDIPTLESYKLLIKGKPEFQTAYDKRLKELQG